MEFSETTCEVFQADEKTKLLVRIWLPDDKPKAIFIAIHGGMAHGGDWVTPALYLKEKGIATYGIDLRWHGAFPEYNKGSKNYFHTDSYDQYVDDVHGFYEWVKTKNPGVPIFVLSHSNGALISLYYGLNKGNNPDIKGYIVSSPWLKNIVELPRVMVAMSKFLAKISPKLAVAPEPLTDVLTHDQAITARHHKDEESGIRGTKATVKLGVESMKTQAWVLENIKNWKAGPIFSVIAGQDKLADPDVSINAMNSITGSPVQITKCEGNYHENFNEVNREEIYGNIWNWMQDKM